MSDQHGGEVPSDTAQTWNGVSRVREPVAWTLLVLAAIILLVSACQLFNLAGAKISVSVPLGASPLFASGFALRASVVAPQFIQVVVQALPVAAVVLVAFSGGVTDRARQVVQTAAVVLTVAFLLGLISLAGAASSHTRPGSWFILESVGLAITATALIFTGAVMWSRPLRSLVPQFQDLGDVDEDFEDEPDFGEHD